MARNYGDLLTGLLLLGVGLLLIWKWEYLVQAAIDSGNAFWGRLGISQASERGQRFAGRVLSQIMGGLCILGGLGHLLAFFTGHDWPLRYANWSALWPL
jgi:hypothetical protein